MLSPTVQIAIGMTPILLLVLAVAVRPAAGPTPRREQ